MASLGLHGGRNLHKSRFKVLRQRDPQVSFDLEPASVSVFDACEGRESRLGEPGCCEGKENPTRRLRDAGEVFRHRYPKLFQGHGVKTARTYRVQGFSGVLAY